MIGFADEAYIDVSSGSGGHGAVSFRREKYVAKGGPDGGDGGKGGSVYFVVKDNLKTLAHLKKQRHFKAENGRPGEGRKKHGRKGADVEIPVPPGTYIKDSESGEVLKDLTDVGDRWLFLEGAKGGRGNWHFRSSVRQTPRYAEDGIPGEEKRIHVELNVMADVGFVGLPNAGKSSLLSTLTNANPKIGAYAFTTKIPNLGMLQGYDRDVVLADIPGIIEGAHDGAGLGIRFLKHISRTKVLAFLIDVSDPDCDQVFEVLTQEVGSFSEELASKPRIILASKIDLDPDGEGYEKLVASLSGGERVLRVSSFGRMGLEEVKQAFVDLVLRAEAGDEEL